MGFIFCKKFGTVLVVLDRMLRYLSYFETPVLIYSPSLQFFFLPLFSSRWRRSRLPPLLYITLSSFCLCLPTDAAHKELASMHGEGTHYRENASPPLHSLSLNQPLFSFFSPPSSRRSAHRSQALPMHALQRNPCSFTQPTRGLLFDYSQPPHPPCALKAPVGQK